MNHDHHEHHDQKVTTVELPRAGTVTDPVCGMTVDPATAAGSTTHNGTTYHFCSRHCLAKFEADPAKYVAPAAKPEGDSCRGAKAPRPPEPPPTGTKYTCPMHPEVVQDGPGTCPKCGMALESIMPQAGADDDTELWDMTRRFRIATVLTVPVFVLAMAPMMPGVQLPHWLLDAANWIGLVLATPVVFWAGWPVFERAWQALKHRTANMLTLIALGTGAAWAYSAAATLAPWAFPAGFADKHGLIPTYFEAAAVITTLVLLGQVLELRARRSTGAAIRALLALAPATAPARSRGRGGGHPALSRPPRRPAARAPRREGAGGRDRGRRLRRRGRVDAHRRADPGGEAAGRRGDRRHREHQRFLRDDRDAHRK